MVRLYNTRVKYLPDNKNRPSFLSDPVFSKVVAAFVKKFPEIPSDLDKVRRTASFSFLLVTHFCRQTFVHQTRPFPFF